MSDGDNRLFESLHLGQTAERTTTVRESDITGFAEVSGDTNPLHLDEAYARGTAFRGRIAHGMLSGAYISAVMGTALPGPGGVYLSQSLTFKRPVRIGDVVTTRATITALDPDSGIATLATVCEVGGKVVTEGEARVMLRRPRRAAAAV